MHCAFTCEVAYGHSLGLSPAVTRSLHAPATPFSRIGKLNVCVLEKSVIGISRTKSSLRGDMFIYLIPPYFCFRVKAFGFSANIFGHNQTTDRRKEFLRPRMKIVERHAYLVHSGTSHDQLAKALGCT